jgi:DNA mismatch repair protein MutL
LEQFKKNQAELQLPLRDNLALALARRAAVKSGQKLMPEEIQSVSWRGCLPAQNQTFLLTGSPTFFTFETSKIESYFTR